MQTNKIFKLGMVALLAATMAACSSTDTEEDTGDTSASGSSSTGSSTGGSASTTGTGNGSTLSASELREQQAEQEALAMTVFYFEFDRSDLSAEARASLIYHANQLKDNPGMRIRLEGHADERGTREYNLALGERRAQSIERYLQVQGVSSGQMETISYGEESPVASGSSEAAYSRNRRVEIH